MGRLIFFLVAAIAVVGYFSWAAIVVFFAWAWLGATVLLAESLVFGAPLFWLLIAGLTVMLWYSLDEIEGYEVDYHGGGLAVFVLLGTVLLLQFFGDIKIFSYIKEHPVSSLVWATGYVGVGLLHATGRFGWFTYRIAKKRLQAKDRFFERNSIVKNVIPANLAHAWKSQVLAYEKPRFRDNKYRLIHWAAYWPWSFAWFLISDLIRDMWKHLVEIFQGGFEWISNRVWKMLGADLSHVTVQRENPPAAEDRIIPRPE